ncbi:MAG: glutathione S-transferase [Sorangiineae bacterium NIC37A_2]|jgi:GST-like protein|nr:MAG: glutathione S-transferase [Sorangiineae bacterium NIC37A_2]
MDLSSFPITKKWPPSFPDRLQLYSFPTPNGVKASIFLEEVGLPYEAHRVDFGSQEQKSEEFLSLNPNGRIPAILDPNGPGGKPIALFESGAILLYLAEKTGQLLPREKYYEGLEWLMFQMAGIGPMFGQLGFFYKFAGREIEDKRPLDRYAAESRRLISVLNGHLRGRKYMLGDEFSLVDIAIFPWVRGLLSFYQAGDLVGFSDFPEVERVLESFLARPAVQRGLLIPE